MSSATSMSAQSGALPVEVTSYVGRAKEAAQARRLLKPGRLLTFTGAGGVGKTRLAIRVAADAGRRSQDDVVFVRLAELRDAELLAGTVAEALGLRDQSGRAPVDVVVGHLRNRRMLLFLDNCEHLVGGCARFVEAVLAGCPEVSVLVTSRQSIGVDGEQVLPVPPLDVPVPEQVRSADELARYDSARLFADRARSLVSSFAITEDNFADLARLCRLLEGLPLAIELAAVRLRSLSLPQVAERLADRLALLTGGSRVAPERQQTLRATLEWSYELCSESERLMWAWVSVFSGAFDLAAAEQVCGGAGIDPDAVLGLIDGLLDKSVLIREEQGHEVRYRMLETLREYGLDRLAEAGDRLRAGRLHRDWYAGVAERFPAGRIGLDQVAMMVALRHDYPNIRVALDFCFTEPGEAATGVRMVAAIVDFWSFTGLFTELRVWMDRALDVLPEQAPERATALRIKGWTALFQGDGEVVAEAFTAAAELLERRPDDVESAYVASGWAVAAVFSGRPAAAIAPSGGAMAGFRAHGVIRGELVAAIAHGIAVGLIEDYQRGREVLSETISRCVRDGELQWRAWAQCCLAFLDMKAVRDAELADRIGTEALRNAHLVGTLEVQAFTTEVLASVAGYRGDHPRAAKLLGVADRGWTTMGSAPAAYVPLSELREEYAASTRQALGDAAFEAAFAEGRALNPDVALRYALGEVEPAAAPAGVLTARQTEIAELVAAGLTSREIAERLVISPRTAETHVDHILTKLGFRTRAQIAAWVAGRAR
ncbi:ATP-binding protein [Amycolatopsis nigrescens]|uniref:ATP-binding protein n=1 Tax=Amycolatopsis nigrescens TaxID=381445 RepID=UPI001FE09414|nr:LuxR C-terminal-related transcriptional regulator [Amycolatopsis nigrescens]